MSVSPSAQTQSEPAAPGDMKGTWIVLAMASICMAVAAYNTTSANTILPQIKSDFDMKPVTLQWVMTLYTLAAATFLPIFGRLADLLRKINVFIFGMAVFAVGALLVAAAPDSTILLIGRLLQGVGSGAMFGTSLGVLSAATPESRRTFVLGFWGAMISLGMSLGPILGGLFGEYLSWRGVFVLDLILLAIAAVLAVQVVRKNYVPDMRPAQVRFDYLGAVSLVLLLGPLAFALSNGESSGWTSARTLVPLGIAVIAGIVFFITELRVTEPLLRIHYFLHPRFLMAALGILIGSFILLCFFYYFNLYVQSPDTMNMSPVMAGAAVLPFTLIMFAFSVVAPRLLASYNFRWPITIGMILLALACFLLQDMNDTSTYREIWWKLIILGVGFGLTFPLLPRLGLRLVREQDTGQASGVINTSLFFGATIGVVAGGVASAYATRTQLYGVIAALPVGSHDRQEVVAALVHDSPSHIQDVLAKIEPATSQALVLALRHLNDDAFNAAMLTSAVVAVIGVVLALLLLRGPVPEQHSAAKLLPDSRLSEGQGAAAR